MADPNALQALLGLSSNRTPGSANVPTYAPNVMRNNARSAALSQFFGLPDNGEISQADLESAFNEQAAAADAAEQRKAELALGPERVKGEYGLQGERIKGEYGMRTEEAKARQMNEARQLQNEFLANQNQTRETGMNQRAAATQQGMNTRGAETQGGMSGRLAASQAEGRARLYETKDTKGNYKAEAPRPAGEGFFGRWVTGPNQDTLQQQEAARIRSQGALNAFTGGGSPAAETMSDAALAQQIQQKRPDATPEQIQAWIAEFRGGR